MEKIKRTVTASDFEFLNSAPISDIAKEKISSLWNKHYTKVEERSRSGFKPSYMVLGFNFYIVGVLIYRYFYPETSYRQWELDYLVVLSWISTIILAFLAILNLYISKIRTILRAGGIEDGWQMVNQEQYDSYDEYILAGACTPGSIRRTYTKEMSAQYILVNVLQMLMVFILVAYQCDIASTVFVLSIFAYKYSIDKYKNNVRKEVDAIV